MTYKRKKWLDYNLKHHLFKRHYYIMKRQATDWERNLQSKYLIKDAYLEFKKRKRKIQNSVIIK